MVLAMLQEAVLSLCLHYTHTALNFDILWVLLNSFIDMSSCLASLTQEMKKSEAVQHALAIRSAWALCNYHSFFQLYLAAPNMSGYLLDLFTDRVRRKALKILLKSWVANLIFFFIHVLFSLSHAPVIRSKQGSSDTYTSACRFEPTNLYFKVLPQGCI